MPAVSPSSSSLTTAPGAGRVWLATGCVAALFVAVMLGSLIAQHRRIDREDPLNTTELQAVRRQLHESPGNEELKERIRRLDLEVRQRHFERLRRNRIGAWMLLAGGGVMVGSMAGFVAVRKRAQLPAISPRSLHEVEELEAARGRRSIAVAGIIALGAMVVIGFTRARPSLEEEIAAIRRSTIEVATAGLPGMGPSDAEALTNWPRFRGPGGNGVASAVNPPVQWDAASDINVLWKAPVPLNGFNSPVVWGDRLFLSGSDGRAREVFCYDTRSGALLWRVPVTLATDEQVAAMKIPELTGLAAPTVATDGRHVYAMFGTGEMVAMDFSGQLVWSKNLGRLNNMYGHSTSLLTWRDRVLAQIDQGDEESGRSRIYALDALTGDVIWQQRRMVNASWATPVLIQERDHEQLILPGDPWLISYNPNDGKELWRVGGFGGDLAPSPVFAGGRVFAVSASQKIMAIRPDGTGDVSNTRVEWEEGGSIPDIASPVSNGEFVFLLVSYDGLSCLEAATGKLVWEHELKGEFEASPTIAGNRLYAISIEGEAFVLECGREPRELGRGHFGEPVHASPAFVGDRMYVRGVTNLFCLGSADQPSKEVAHER